MNKVRNALILTALAFLVCILGLIFLQPFKGGRSEEIRRCSSVQVVTEGKDLWFDVDTLFGGADRIENATVDLWAYCDHCTTGWEPDSPWTEEVYREEFEARRTEAVDSNRSECQLSHYGKAHEWYKDKERGNHLFRGGLGFSVRGVAGLYYLPEGDTLGPFASYIDYYVDDNGHPRYIKVQLLYIQMEAIEYLSGHEEFVSFGPTMTYDRSHGKRKFGACAVFTFMRKVRCGAKVQRSETHVLEIAHPLKIVYSGEEELLTIRYRPLEELRP